MGSIVHRNSFRRYDAEAAYRALRLRRNRLPLYCVFAAVSAVRGGGGLAGVAMAEGSSRRRPSRRGRSIVMVARGGIPCG